ncbi:MULTISPECIES: sugar ABC transporter substrate-binding protein [Microbacterium]|uniref:Sugar ABC transporter substrate-binding protein n=1 Tax=Microbacterium hominis TaxID=162426 RepID=A0A134DI24_9MICO|nr:MULTISPECIES: sugar ABC transporter substrate-binding protein [Microbacterium]AUG30176.1 sugar ABC transporter substrate-binding protein [Microbacterium hominis]KXC06194.1 ABC transporter [Microbacterium hominis]QOC25890.1 sugar ABC transporter substrate-binding protein [Microbacterium hominis]QOC29869.1 sugar ABC transporter substrate-binding protein [Microbacterium hominis]QYF97737.1 sugar ABC transporter substrate-binding protein [Microbacterium sp. PAMC21962]
MNRTAPIAGIGVLAVAGLALAGCSGSGSPAAGGDVTITYSNFISAGGNEKNLQAIVDAFEKENPGITVEVKTLPYTDYFTALQTDLAGGTAADVFDIEFANYAAYQKSGVLAALDGVDTSVYQASLVDAYATDGTSYALPSSFSNVVLFYNADLFDAAGLAYPTADWTWADEKAAAEKLTDAGAGVWGDYQPISYHEFYKAVAQAGGQFLTADGKVGFNSPEGIAAATWLVGKSGTTMPTAEQGAGTPDFDSKLFADGKLAMWHSGIWMFGGLADAGISWDIAVEPGDTQHASALFSNAVGVSAGTKNKEAATKFAEFLTSSKTTVDTRLTAGWELPPIADQTALSAYLDITPPANRQAVFDSLEEVALAPSIGDGQAEMQDIVTEELTEAAAGRKTVEAALADAEKRITPLLG